MDKFAPRRKKSRTAKDDANLEDEKMDIAAPILA